MTAYDCVRRRGSVHGVGTIESVERGLCGWRVLRGAVRQRVDRFGVAGLEVCAGRSWSSTVELAREESGSALGWNLVVDACLLGQLGRAVKAIDSKSIGVTRVSSSLTAVDLLLPRLPLFTRLHFGGI